MFVLIWCWRGLLLVSWDLVDFSVGSRGCLPCWYLFLCWLSLWMVLFCVLGEALSVLPLGRRFLFWGIVFLFAVGSCIWMVLALVPLLERLTVSRFLLGCSTVNRSFILWKRRRFCNEGVVLVWVGQTMGVQNAFCVYLTSDRCFVHILREQ